MSIFLNGGDLRSDVLVELLFGAGDSRVKGCENRRQSSYLFVSVTEASHRRSSDKLLSGLLKSALVNKLREFNGAPTEALQNDELSDLMLPTIRADFELYENYQYHPESPLECP